MEIGLLAFNYAIIGFLFGLFVYKTTYTDPKFRGLAVKFGLIGGFLWPVTMVILVLLYVFEEK